MLRRRTYKSVHAYSKDNTIHISHSDIHKPLILGHGSSVRDSHITPTRNGLLWDGLQIHQTNDLTIDRVVIEGLRAPKGLHIDGVQFRGGNNFRLTNSLIDTRAEYPNAPSTGVNAALYFAQGTATNVTINCNHLIKHPGSWHPVRFYDVKQRLTFTNNTITGLEPGRKPVNVRGHRPTHLNWSGNHLDDGTPVRIPENWQ